MDYQFDLQTAIEAYLANNGIECKVTVDYDPNDPDAPYTYDLNVDWYEDDDCQSFVVRDCQRFTEETLFDLWVRDREQTHAQYLAMQKEVVA